MDQRREPDDRTYTDGNALAGPLGELFTVDITTACVQCVACGRSGVVATLRLYGSGPGLVARCPACEAVVLRLVRGDQSAWLDLSGTVSLQIPLPRPEA